MNPFYEKPMNIFQSFCSFNKMYPKPYDKNEVDPYTKTRIILMNGTEFEANWFSHNFSRHCTNNDIRRELALVREVEKQQQMTISLLKPIDETILEHTIGYEQLAVDLTAELAKKERDFYVKQALDFALLEDFDHLYRYSNLLEMRDGVLGERLVGKYTEIMPGRPTVAHHRYPMDNLKRAINCKTASLQTVLNTMIITAAEQQTMNYYMNVATLYDNDDLGRKLYEEIGLVEEEHVTQYGSLIDSSGTWLEMLLLHEYCECYLYYSCFKTETCPHVKAIWEQFLDYEIAHLHKAAELLKKYENKDWCEVIPNAEFPVPISLHENVDYVRGILGNTVQFTGHREEYEKIEKLNADADFFKFQHAMMPDVKKTPSHLVIEQSIESNGKDYRFETGENPIEALRDRKEDNITVGREANAAKSTSFSPLV